MSNFRFLELKLCASETALSRTYFIASFIWIFFPQIKTLRLTRKRQNTSFLAIRMGNRLPECDGHVDDEDMKNVHFETCIGVCEMWPDASSSKIWIFFLVCGVCCIISCDVFVVVWCTTQVRRGRETHPLYLAVRTWPNNKSKKYSLHILVAICTWLNVHLRSQQENNNNNDGRKKPFKRPFGDSLYLLLCSL